MNRICGVCLYKIWNDYEHMLRVGCFKFFLMKIICVTCILIWMCHALLTTTYIWLTSDRNAILVRNRPITLRRNSLCIVNWNSTVKLFYSQKCLMKWYIYLLLNHFIWLWFSAVFAKGVLTKNGDVWNERVSIYNWPLVKNI